MGIIEAYYWRRVTPLMSHTMRLFGMAPVVSEKLLGPSLISGAFPSEVEIRFRLEEILDKDRADGLVIPMPGQPPMLPNPRAVDFVCFVPFARFFSFPHWEESFVIDPMFRSCSLVLLLGAFTCRGLLSRRSNPPSRKLDGGTACPQRPSRERKRVASIRRI